MRLASLFCDHAVLQRGIAIPVWGWVKPGERVRAQLGKHAAETFAAQDGKFLLRLPPLPAGGPFELKVTAASGGSVVARDVWVGEVWLASGQSNMHFSLAASGESVEREIPGVRMVNIPNIALMSRQSDVEAAWRVADPQNAASFSAVAHHFARKLHESLGVAVGILHSAWGGTRVEAWTSREALVQNPDTRAELERYEATVYSPEYLTRFAGAAASDVEAQAKAKGFPLDPGNVGHERGWANPNFDDASWKTMNLPGSWQGHGLVFSGSLWFRREVTVPAQWSGRELLLKIGAVDKHDVTYFNGERVGATGTGLEEQHWNQPREYRVPARLVRSGRNVVAARAYSFAFDGGLIGPSNKMALELAAGEAKPISLTGAWRYEVEHNFGKVIRPLAAPFGPGNANSPGILYDNMIAPLAPYALRGAIWYQGESNAGNAAKYRDMMVNMIRDWRRVWGQGDFPFLQVQLANYQSAESYQDLSTWARLREAQMQALAEPQTGIAVAIDIGEALDIHPKNKRDVGFRLAQWALATTYGKDLVASGPLYTEMTVERDRIRIHFKNVGGGLVSKGGDLKTFAIAGADRQFQLAKAEIEGDTVVVQHPDVGEPVAVRYAWADNPEGCNLYNAAGLPASPFRTDSW